MFIKRIFPLSCCRLHWLIEMELTGFFCTVAQMERSPAVLDTLNNCNLFPWVSLFPQLLLLCDWRNSGDPSKMSNCPLLREFTVYKHNSASSAVSGCLQPHGLSPPRLLRLGFSRQGDWSGLPCPSPGDPPDPGIKSRLLYHLSHTGFLGGLPFPFPWLRGLAWWFCLQQAAQQWTDLTVVVRGHGSAASSQPAGCSLLLPQSQCFLCDLMVTSSANTSFLESAFRFVVTVFIPWQSDRGPWWDWWNKRTPPAASSEIALPLPQRLGEGDQLHPFLLRLYFRWYLGPS